MPWQRQLTQISSSLGFTLGPSKLKRGKKVGRRGKGGLCQRLLFPVPVCPSGAMLVTLRALSTTRVSSPAAHARSVSPASLRYLDWSWFMARRSR